MSEFVNVTEVEKLPINKIDSLLAIDDNKNKKNKYILGVPIVGGREEIALNSVKSSMITVVSILATGLLATIVVALFSPFTPAVLSTYGTSLKMWLKDGTTKYIPMSEQSELMVGSTPNINEVSLIVLAREGDEPILRVK